MNKFQFRANGIVLVVVGLFFFLPVQGHAAEGGNPGDFGLGAIFGSPTGFSGKYWLSSQAAVDGAVAWDLSHHDDFEIHSDYLWHIDLDQKRLNISEGRLPLYFGLGVRVLAGDDSEGGIRFPLGVSYLFDRAPVELFAEIVPVLEFAPDTAGEIAGGVGVRYYFKTGR